MISNIPLVTIITVVKNSENFIESTIKSVINQTLQDKEYIIIDGKSNDNTINIIKKYQNKINLFISEKDTNLYDAMNKGASLSKGKWIFFLNSGDKFIDNNVLLNIQKDLSLNTNIIHFNCKVVNSKGIDINVRKFPNLTSCLLKWPCVQHQSVFCTKKIFLELNGFNTKYQILGDYDFFLRAHLCNEEFTIKKDIYISNFQIDGISSNTKNIPIFIKEIIDIQKKNLNKIYYPMILFLFTKYIISFLPYSNFLFNFARKVFLVKR